MTIDWAIVETAIPLLARGTLVTLQVSLIAGVLACMLGFMLGLCALSNMRLLRGFVLGYVDFVRGTPLLIQIFLVFFALPVIGIRLSEISAASPRSPSSWPATSRDRAWRVGWWGAARPGRQVDRHDHPQILVNICCRRRCAPLSRP